MSFAVSAAARIQPTPSPRRRYASVPAAMIPCSTPEEPTYHSTVAPANHRAAMCGGCPRERDAQPLADRVIAREQRPHESEADAVEQRVAQVEVNQMGAEESPVLGSLELCAVVAQQEPRGLAERGDRQQQQTAAQQQAAVVTVVIESPERARHAVHEASQPHLL